VPTVTAIRYGLFECVKCTDDPNDDCTDSCAMRWPDELNPAGEYWPSCKCCGEPAQLVAPLVAA
jgi:hypothetical protein